MPGSAPDSFEDRLNDRLRALGVDPSALLRQFPGLTLAAAAVAKGVLRESELTTLRSPGSGRSEPTVVPLPCTWEVGGARYHLESRLGGGGMGQVFLARQEPLGRTVAVKVLDRWSGSADQERARFRREARAIASLNHRNIVQIFELHDDHDPPFFVMERVPGTSLRDHRFGSFPDVARAFETIARAVDALHHQGILHRDLKPDNILITAEAEPKIVDFGLAWVADADLSRLTTGDTMFGTLPYMAPELFTDMRRSSKASDVYALGVCLFEALTGRRPFLGPVAEIVKAITFEDPPFPVDLRPEIPEPLQRIALKAIERDPAKRYPSARELSEDLLRFREGRTISARPTVYGNRLAHRAELHMEEVRKWRDQNLLAPREFDRLRGAYDRLLSEESWLGEWRRIRAPEVFQYLGAWCVLLGAALLSTIYWDKLSPVGRILGTSAPAVLAILMGLGLRARNLRGPATAALLLGGALLPLSLAVSLSQAGWAAVVFDPQYEWFPRDHFTNLQLAIACAAGAAIAAVWTRLHRSAAFAYLAVALAILAYWFAWSVFTSTRMDLVDGVFEGRWRRVPWLGTRFLLLTALLAVPAIWLDRRGRAAWATPGYSIATASYLIGATLVALGAPEGWLAIQDSDHAEEAQRFLLILSGLAYGTAAFFIERKGTLSQRRQALVLLWLAPADVLLPLLLGAISDGRPDEYWIAPDTMRVALIVAALIVATSSVPIQLRTYFYQGLGVFAVAVFLLAERDLPQRWGWAVSVSLAGALTLLVGILLEWRRLRSRPTGAPSGQAPIPS